MADESALNRGMALGTGALPEATGSSSPGRRGSRRAVVRGALGTGIAALAAGRARAAAGQSAVATPIASPIPADEGFRPPPGITVVRGGEETAGNPARGGTVRLVRPGSSVANFNPAAFAQDPQVTLSYLEPLVRPNPETLRPEPWLAERWAWSDGGGQLTLTLRDGLVWHDGTPVTAADAAFSYEVYRDDADSAVSSLFALVASAAPAGDRDLVVTFDDLDANWLFNAATLPIFSRHQYEAFWKAASPAGRTLSGFDWKASPPTGTGPWQVSAWEERRVEFVPFDHYWRTGPWLDALVVAAEPGARNRLDDWAEGKSQITWPVRTRDVAVLEDAKGKLYPAPAASVMFAAFNFANPNLPAGSFWTDLNVRRAASLAIDRQRYAQEVFGGFIRSDAAGTVSQPWANAPSLKSPGHNPDAAAVLLGEAGWVDYDGDGIREDVNGTPLRPVAIVREDSRPELAAVLARVARDLFEVGIGLSVEVVPVPEFEQRWVTRRDYDLIAYAYDQLPGFTDYDLYGSAWDIRTNPAGWNPGGYANPDADAAIADFLAAVSIERQANALRRLQQAVDDDLFGLWLGFPDDLILVAADVEGFQPDMAWQTARTWELWRAPAAVSLGRGRL
jgi:peptide/nickel transport system substrate-binding protein